MFSFSVMLTFLFCIATGNVLPTICMNHVSKGEEPEWDHGRHLRDQGGTLRMSKSTFRVKRTTGFLLDHCLAGRQPHLHVAE